jgi:hypothetical protein
MPNALSTSSGLSSSPPSNNSNNLRLSVNSFRQIQQHFMHGDMSDVASSPSLHNFNNSPTSLQVKNHRQVGERGNGGGPVRERKRTVRSAPNG